MSLGICCQYKEIGPKGIENVCDEKHLQFGQYTKGKYSNLQIEKTWEHNALGLFSVLKRLNKEGVSLFRISCGILPLYDCLPELLHNCQPLTDVLKDIGNFTKEKGMRITTHPDQFVVLSSDRPEVIAKSKLMLTHYGWLFDQMNLERSPYNPINIHGGARGNFSALIESIKSLPEEVKTRLTLENDESSYNVKDLEKIFQETGTPIVWDSHHHTFNDGGLSMEDALKLAKGTWGKIKPITHLSNTEPALKNGSFTERRKHCDLVHYIPECQRLANNTGEIDIEMEFKMTSLAVFKAVKDFDIKL